MKNDDFELLNLPEAARDPEIKAEDFVLQQADKEIHEQKFQTKPTTFLKDSLKRFKKNKSSVVATFILGILIVTSVVTIIVNKATGYDVMNPDSEYLYLEPRLFPVGTGFWDGTVNKEHIPVDTTKSEDPAEWRPNPEYYYEDGFVNGVNVTGYEYTSEVSGYGKSGYAQVGYYGTYDLNFARIDSYATSSTDREIPAEYDNKYFPGDDDDKGDDFYPVIDLERDVIKLDHFETVDYDKFVAIHNRDKLIDKLPEHVIPENFELGEAYVTFNYLDKTSPKGEYISIPLTSKKTVHNIGIGSSLSGYEEEGIVNVSEVILNYLNSLDKEDPNREQRIFRDFYFSICVEKPTMLTTDTSVCALVKNFNIDLVSPHEKFYEYLNGYLAGDQDTGTVDIPGYNFDSAMEMMSRTTQITASTGLKFNDTGYWTVPKEFDAHKFVRQIHNGLCAFADFTYNSYQGTFGRRENIKVEAREFDDYVRKGYIDYDFIPLWDEELGYYVPSDDSYFIILNEEESPILEEVDFNNVIFDANGNFLFAYCTVTYYRYLGRTSMPLYIMGTDKTGVSMFRFVFEGLFYSLALGVITFIVCFLFGLFWGAVSGYFGGAVDLIMERLTDILAGIPWIVLMTIIVIKWEPSLLTFAIALCLTGWIGTASTTRTQFYRFRGREYVLASRTLGASDARLITKHILPNAMGTIITGAVLMIPSVIFSEATISYLGLGFKNLASLGVILSNNQSELLSHPYLLIFPSVIIALIMISFNLFGNGLRDAINPSLKGEEE